jgi:hypothetical protein
MSLWMDRPNPRNPTPATPDRLDNFHMSFHAMKKMDVVCS